MKRKIDTKRWTNDDESVYFCEACKRFHYFYSRIGQSHRKYAVECK